jgi:hypothetical protein
MLYSYPDTFLQAIVFDPSSVTGYVEQQPANQITACTCNQPELNDEPRIYRVYDYKEVLANLRIFHKVFFSPERHVQEVRVVNDQSHSMKSLALFLEKTAGERKSAHGEPWYKGLGNNRYGKDSKEPCTQAFRRAQRDSCKLTVEPSASFSERCPQGSFER